MTARLETHHEVRAMEATTRDSSHNTATRDSTNRAAINTIKASSSSTAGPNSTMIKATSRGTAREDSNSTMMSSRPQ